MRFGVSFLFCDLTNPSPCDMTSLTATAQSVGFMSANGRDVIKRTIININSIVSGWNYDILTSIIAQSLNCHLDYHPIVPSVAISAAVL